jgi:hypothetical protein
VELKTDYEKHKMKTKMSRLFNVGDSKMIGKIEKELQKQMQATITFSDNISMEC